MLPCAKRVTCEAVDQDDAVMLSLILLQDAMNLLQRTLRGVNQYRKSVSIDVIEPSSHGGRAEATL